MKEKKWGLLGKSPSIPYEKQVRAACALDYASLSDTELKARIVRSIPSDNQDIDGIVPLFALLKEVILRLTGLCLFDTQLSTAFSLYQGRIAQLPTGEGKTLAAVLPAAARALQGQGVHVLVFNDYLAKRDYTLTRPIYEYLGLAPSFVQQSASHMQRKLAYEGNPLYVCAKEAGFDYLRNFICQDQSELLLARRDYAIVDEADSILIDEARIPLVIAGNAPEEALSSFEIRDAVNRLAPGDCNVNKLDKQVYLTDKGIRHMEFWLGVDNLYDEANLDLLSMVHAALQAKYLLERDRDYLVKNDGIQIIDELTGRVSENRKYPDILHSAVEAKEGLGQEQNSLIYNSMSMQNYLEQYKTLSGMTGTIETSSEEIHSAYGLNVDVIPPHIPCIRQDHEDVLFYTKQEKFEAIVQEILNAHLKKQPVLVGTQSVMESEHLSSLLDSKDIPHWVLNAKNDEQEAELIARAGEPGRVTVSTNMAGRGVDIKLGGLQEQDKDLVANAGGLLVISTGMNRSVRIDNQLRGRAGRQGDPGESRFFISLEDEIPMKYEVGQNAPTQKEAGRPIGLSRLKKAVRKSQKHAEGQDAESRYMLKKYAFILEQQRQVMTNLREEILTGKKEVDYLEEADPVAARSLLEKAGEQGVKKAQRQLSLYFINLHWAQYLESMEYVRDGIHLTVVGGKNPIDEYHRTAIQCFDEMLKDIQQNVAAAMKINPITEDGIDMEHAGLCGATTTWTYQIDDSNSQFNQLHAWSQKMYQKITNAAAALSDKVHSDDF